MSAGHAGVESTPVEAVRVVIQGGGRGERLRPLTLNTPKPLLPIGGVPMIERLLRQLSETGFRRFSVLTAWLGEQIEEHLRGLRGLPDDIQLEVVSESWGLGTLGGIGKLAPCSGTTLSLFGDLVTTLDFRRLCEVHAQSGAQITLASHMERYRVRLGEIVLRGDDVIGYQEKPEKRFLICSGIAVLEPPVLELFAKLSPPIGLGDLVNAAIAKGYQVGHWPHDSLWFDVNDLHGMQLAEAGLRDQMRRHG